ncbi:MAG: LD-carboxypeptidase [Bacteroidia bacterium]|nr:LD-carboxypeptidase [Bacteroidia bacterium]
MILPPYLTRGDTVHLVAPARKVTETEIAGGILRLVDEGFNVVTSKNFYKESHQYAGTDEERTADLQNALDDPGVKAIICARGGYGTLRVLDTLDFGKFNKHPKWLAGFSDITVLHARLQRLGYASIHGPLLINFSKDEYAADLLMEMLKGGNTTISSPPHDLSIPGKVNGVITGGNLSLLYALQGSADMPDLRGKILFIEDLDEYLYHMDRMMRSLWRSGTFKGVAAVIIGGMSDMKDNPVPFGKPAEEIIREMLEPLGVPLCFGFPSGHILPNTPIKFGVEAELSVSEKGGILRFMK